MVSCIRCQRVACTACWCACAVRTCDIEAGLSEMSVTTNVEILQLASPVLACPVAHQTWTCKPVICVAQVLLIFVSRHSIIISTDKLPVVEE